MKTNIVLSQNLHQASCIFEASTFIKCLCSTILCVSLLISFLPNGNIWQQCHHLNQLIRVVSLCVANFICCFFFFYFSPCPFTLPRLLFMVYMYIVSFETYSPQSIYSHTHHRNAVDHFCLACDFMVISFICLRRCCLFWFKFSVHTHTHTHIQTQKIQLSCQFYCDGKVTFACVIDCFNIVVHQSISFFTFAIFTMRRVAHVVYFGLQTTTPSPNKIFRSQLHDEYVIYVMFVLDVLSDYVKDCKFYNDSWR